MKLINLLAPALVLALISTQSHAVLLDGNYVGEMDSLVSTTSGLNGDQAAVDWVNDVLATSYTVSDMYKDDNPVGYQVTDDGDHIAFALTTTPEHFVIKNGSAAIKGIDFDNALFTNNSLFNWAVIALSDLTNFQLGDDLYLSHVSEFGTVEVSEPGNLALLAIGLVGLAAARRRQG